MLQLIMLAILELWPAVRAYVNARPDVAPGHAAVVLDAAQHQQTAQVPAALIVVLAWHESRFDPKAGPACGVMQVYPKDIARPASDCAIWATDVAAGVRAGVVEIETMLKDKRVNGNLRRALLYRACGNKAFVGTGCTRDKVAWVNTILRHVARIVEADRVDRRRLRA